MNKAHEMLQMFAEMVTHEKALRAYTWILENGREYDTFNAELSTIVQQRNHCEQKQCFYNAQRIATETGELLYVEGYAHHIIPVHHAWLLDADGRIVDPTWVIGGLPEEAEYFGIVIPADYIREVWLETEESMELMFRWALKKAAE